MPAERQVAVLTAELASLTRTLEVQAAQIAQLVRVQEELARKVAQASAQAPAASQPPALARVGVFVDAANIELACDRLRHRVDWKKMLDYLTEGRQLVRAVAYSPVHDDPGVSLETQRFAEPFLEKGYRVVTKPLRRFSDGTIKANVDIEMALDILEMLDRLDVVVLVSGDGDFQRLVEVIQSKGVRVEVVSVGSSTASNLRQAADRFIDIQSILQRVRA
ncbi:NYN domain-containing protein [Tepidiforma sp.]|uniref:LabA-like NYN domain-containing protein n=1 Tax=Tepidiforma sp. TaxID=2682230 RepID=UPI002ADE2C56|nr:NYN domain-containing protein [Tepidiforma sp.]